MNEGVQKFHALTTSRLGGVGLILGTLMGIALSVKPMPNVASLGGWLLIASIPVFAGGLIEDLTHSVSAGLRLLLSLLSALFVWVVLDVGVSRTDIQWIDYFLVFKLFALALTMLVVSGFTHSVNLIDGFHGLSSGTMSLILVGLALFSIEYKDWTMVNLCFLMLAVNMGFFVWNWPFGKIFQGDSGAYFMGFWVIELGLLVVQRLPSMSPMAPLVLGFYPILETVFTMYRRKFVRSHPIGHPDALHLHTLIFRRLARKNALVAPLIWPLTAVNGLVALIFSQNTHALLIWMLVFTLIYTLVYARIVRFQKLWFY